MASRLITGPTIEPITRTQAKRHLRLDIDDDDQDVDTLISVARQHIEKITGYSMLAQTWDYILDWFPSGWLELPRWPVQSITSISYLDASGASQVLAGSNYMVDLYSSPARVVSASLFVPWPTTQDRISAVTVRFVSGHTNVDDVPTPLIQAMKLLIAHFYENREEVINSIGGNVIVLPKASSTLMANFKVGYV